MENERYVVVKKNIGKKSLYYILDDKTNKLVSDGFRRHEDADRIAKIINKEMSKNDAK